MCVSNIIELTLHLSNNWLSGAPVWVGGSDFIGDYSLSLHIYIYIYIYIYICINIYLHLSIMFPGLPRRPRRARVAPHPAVDRGGENKREVVLWAGSLQLPLSLSLSNSNSLSLSLSLGAAIAHPEGPEFDHGLGHNWAVTQKPPPQSLRRNLKPEIPQVFRTCAVPVPE